MKSAQRVAFVSFLCAAAVAAAKLVVAVRIGSVALLGDGLHSALDMLATAMTLGAVRWASMPPDREHPYGHGRAENLAALGEAVLMVGIAAFVALEAVHRLRAGTVIDVRSYALVVILVAIGVDATRARALHRAARRYGSPALEADAWNFTADIAESVGVFAGLGLARLGFAAGDPLAGLLVSAGMAFMAVQIGRNAFQVLMDRHPPALAEQLATAASAVPGVVSVEDMRVRRLGADVHAEVTVTVPRTSSVEQSHAITEAVEEAVAQAVPGTSATVHVEPSSEGEDVVARAFAAANRIGMADQVHNVLAIRHPEGLWLMLHAKIAPDTPLHRAHDVTDALERELRREMPSLARVEIHLEPLESRRLRGTVVTSSHQALVADVQRIAASHRPITRCHAVAVSEADDGLHLVLHCEAPPDTPIGRIHDASLATENDIHRAHLNVRTVTIHFEPERPPVPS